MRKDDEISRGIEIKLIFSLFCVLIGLCINAPGFKPTPTLHSEYWPLLCCLEAKVYGERTALRWHKQIACCKL